MVLSPGFEEIGVTTVVSALHRAKVHVEMIQLGGYEPLVYGQQNFGIYARHLWPNQKEGVRQAVILPGGEGAVNSILSYRELENLLNDYINAGSYVAAIGEAPLVLNHFGLFSGYQITANSTLTSQLSANYTVLSAGVVTDRTLITAQGPYTSFKLATKLIRLLFPNQQVDNKVADEMGYPLAQEGEEYR
ncbi:hypothetical protein FBUS_03984 [Fasciolopsis buskii]|nr:hypothetical protein FBUS_03984 [Fasciolopsis buski]